MEELTCFECGSNNFRHITEKIITCLNCGATSNPIRFKIKPPTKQQSKSIKQKPNLTLSAKFWADHVKNHNSTEKNITIALGHILRIAIELDLSTEIIKKASNNYKKIYIRNCSKGRKKSSVCAACVYLACKQLKHPISLTRVSEVAKVQRKELGRDYKHLVIQIKEKSNVAKYSTYDYILGLLSSNENHKELTSKLLESLERDKYLQGKNPLGIFAACAYIASNILELSLTQRQLSELTRVTQTTIRSRYKEISSHYTIRIKL
jgi:transcription initiation factor TFIIB